MQYCLMFRKVTHIPHIPPIKRSRINTCLTWLPNQISCLWKCEYISEHQCSWQSVKFCYNIRPFNSCICYCRTTNNNTTSINAKCKADRKDRAFRLHATKTHKQKQAQPHSFFISELDERPAELEVRCRPQSRQGRFGEEKNLLPLQGIEFRIVQPIA